ncbi:hypothetical protein FRC17_003786 [Serendipita sp. 399]|nr:hypothetical protein FRC17_003786 [Serendipita sp. 399]
MSNTTLLVLKLYAGFLLASFLAALMCWKLPEFLPGKRAFALQLCLYHTIATTALLHTPRFIPITLGATPESLGVTIERIWCAMHGLLSAAFALWWHITLPYAVALKAANHPSKAH